MPLLKNIHKELIVIELATYASPSEVKQKVKEEFGLDIGYQQIANYNLDSSVSIDLGGKWKELYRHTRNEFKDEVAKHQISTKAYRLEYFKRYWIDS